MAQITMPGRREKAISTGQILGLAGNMIAPGIGGAIGGLVGGKADQEQAQQPGLIQSDNAMSRRMQQFQPQSYDQIEDPMIAMQKAQEALKTQSPAMQKRYAPVLNQGMQSYQQQGIA